MTWRQKCRARGFVVEDHPYDRGYWKRVTGSRKPADQGEAYGWEAADAELKAEAVDFPATAN